MTLTIRRLGHLGDGIADGPVFVPLSLPGEVVEGEIADGRMAQPRIITPSSDRVRPPCPHFKSCGGCALQHASDAFVAEWKQGVVRTALAAQGLEGTFRPIITSPPQSRRRAVLAGRRTKKGVLVGFHARASDVVVGIPDCRLLHPDLMAALPALEEIVPLAASRKGEVSFTITRSEAGVDVAVANAKPLDGQLWAALGSLSQRHHLARLAWDGELVVELNAPAQRFGAAHVVPPPGAFLQATAEGQAALTAAVLEAVEDAGTVADLFAGCGTFALPLAARAEVHAVEGDAAMLKALDQGWRRAAGLKAVSTETRDLFRRPLMPDELNRYDAIVIDPPRAGAEAQMARIADSGLATVAAVSCNPVTFARDARMLCDAGFRLNWVQVVDQFRWSPHVELVAHLSR
ncbi:MAG: RNA methyltransferase [Confluentimicrobium sp.]|uniref:class I SAM-dependent RNA methyltransferase n=1 Tax=Actibacterium sp. TaxID=1872125 RepID=UPI000C62C5C7|nr:class I SAM-dependent RNA methyltransferase [Actibacterium sp.]MBC57053.1 RNA methyltransferase [Actibacterium sp.]|tara:strand:+ start:4661 stop:5872 length:1212 start_codon:yes stop_codon:yes gene_type:complete